MRLDASEFLFFDSSKEASIEVNAFLNLRFIKKHKPAVFEKLLHANELKFKV